VNKAVNWDALNELVNDAKNLIHMEKGSEASQQEAMLHYIELRRELEAPVLLSFLSVFAFVDNVMQKKKTADEAAAEEGKNQEKEYAAEVMQQQREKRKTGRVVIKKRTGGNNDADDDADDDTGTSSGSARKGRTTTAAGLSALAELSSERTAQANAANDLKRARLDFERQQAAAATADRGLFLFLVCSSDVLTIN